MTGAERIVIPRCIGCGAMREFERCEDGCNEERLELVAADALEALEAVERSCRARINLGLPPLRQLQTCIYKDIWMSLSGEDIWMSVSGGGWREAYIAAARAARRALHDVAAAGAWPVDVTSPERISVWRCARCGAVDAPQECLGICIWRRFEWVRVADYEARLAYTDAARELERRVFGLLGRVAFATPRADAWERSCRALGREAEILLARCAQAGEPSAVHV